MPSRRLRFIAALVLVPVLALVAAVAAGIVTFERHHGFFGPAWSPDGRTVYCIERSTAGFTWGPGWEFFTPPASAWVWSDALDLSAIDVADGRKRVLERIRGGPVQGRVTRNYRSRIFGIVHAHIDATGDSVRFVVTMNLPRVPASDPWHLRGTWPRGPGPVPAWRNEWAHGGGTSAPVLVDDRELLVADGPAAYPAAILAVGPDRGYSVVAQTAGFVRRTPGELSRWIAEHSRRDAITRQRELDRVRGELERGFRDRGASETEAALAAHDRLQELGHLPRDPVLVARSVEDSSGEPVFEIPAAYFAAGLFRDIAAAVAAPGESVETGTGDYLKYSGDDVGPRLREHRGKHSTFVVRVDGGLYRLEVVKP